MKASFLFFIFIVFISIKCEIIEQFDLLKKSLIDLDQKLNKLNLSPTFVSNELERFKQLSNRFKLNETGIAKEFNANVQSFITLIKALDNNNQREFKFIAENSSKYFALKVSLEIIENYPFGSKDIARYFKPIEEISAIALNFDGKSLATGTYDKKVFLFDITENKISNEWNVQEVVRTVAFHPRDKLIAVGTFGKGTNSQNISILQYNPYEKQAVKILNAHTDDVTAVTFNHDGSLMASISDDGDVKLWDTSSWNNIITFASTTKEGHKSHGHSVSFNSDGSLLASGALDGTVKVWDIKSKKLLYTFIDGIERTDFKEFMYLFSCAQFHPKNPNLLLVAIRSQDDQKTSFNLYEKEGSKFTLKQEFDAPSKPIIFANFNFEGSKIVAREDKNNDIYLFDVDSKAPFGVIKVATITTEFAPAIFNKNSTEIITAYNFADFQTGLVFWRKLNIRSSNALLVDLIDNLAKKFQ